MLWKRLALVPIGIVLGLLMLEGALQVGAFFMKRSKRGELPVAFVTGNLRVLCLGDSNTYGLWVERSEAYPQQLEALWNERIAAPKLEVLNLGFPGTNSSRLVRDLPRLLETFAPDYLILMVGVNDYWTLPFPLDAAQETRPQKSFLARHSLVYRLYYLIRRGHVADKVEIIMDEKGSLLEGARLKARIGEVEFDMGFARAAPGLSGDSDALRMNLLRLIEQARAAKTPLYLMTYASRLAFYPPRQPRDRSRRVRDGYAADRPDGDLQADLPESRLPRLSLQGRTPDGVGLSDRRRSDHEATRREHIPLSAAPTLWFASGCGSRLPEPLECVPRSARSGCTRAAGS